MSTNKITFLWLVGLKLSVDETRSRWWLKRSRAEPPHVTQHTAKFSGHTSCERGDIDFSNCQVTWRWSRD